MRVRSSGTFQNCKFNVFWVRVENETYVEGQCPRTSPLRTAPLPPPIHPTRKFFTWPAQKATGQTGMPAYKCKNIVLDGCTFTGGTYGADAGNQLIVK